MTLLSELQSKVKAAKADKDAQKVELQAQADYYNLELRPVMVRINEYFMELIEGLNIIKPEISSHYPLNPDASLGVELRQSNYHYNYDNIKTPHQIDIVCECYLDKPLEFHVPTKIKVEHYARVLNDYNFLHSSIPSVFFDY